MVVGGALLVAGGNATVLLEAVDEPLDAVSLAVTRAVKGSASSFRTQARDRHPNPTAMKVGSTIPAGVALVADDTIGPNPGPASSWAFDGSLLHERGEVDGFVAMAGPDDRNHGPAVALCSEVDLGR